MHIKTTLRKNNTLSYHFTLIRIVKIKKKKKDGQQKCLKKEMKNLDSYTDLLQLTVGLLPDKPIELKYPKLKMHLIQLIYRTL